MIDATLYLPASDVDFLETVLKTNAFAAGTHQSQVDVDAFNHFTLNKTKINDSAHPLVHAWFKAMSEVVDRAALPADSAREEDAVEYTL